MVAGPRSGLNGWANAVAVSAHSVLLLVLGLVAWRSEPTGPNREPAGFDGALAALPFLILPLLSLVSAVTLGRWFWRSPTKRRLGLVSAGLMAVGYAAMLVGVVLHYLSGSPDELTPAFIPWLVGYFLLLPVGLLLLPFAAAASKTLPVMAAILVLMTWWGAESLSIGGAFNSVWSTAPATVGWIWVAATALRGKGDRALR